MQVLQWPGLVLLWALMDFLSKFLVCLHQSGHQQDAQEYLITLLNKLIEEMQNVMRHSTGMCLTEI